MNSLSPSDPEAPESFNRPIAVDAVVSVENVSLSVWLSGPPVWPPAQYPFVDPSLPACILKRATVRFAVVTAALASVENVILSATAVDVIEPDDTPPAQ